MKVIVCMMLFILSLAVAALIGFLIGHDRGYYMGKKEAEMEAMFKSHKIALKHNRKGSK